jgi:hypothetical protein
METATLTLLPQEASEASPGGANHAPVIFSSLHDALNQMLEFLRIHRQTPDNKLAHKEARKVLKDIYGFLSPESREAVDVAFKPIGFLNFVSENTFPVIATTISAIHVSMMENALEPMATQPPPTPPSATGQSPAAQPSATPPAIGSGMRGCGCGTPGCNRGGSIKMSPGFLQKVRKLMGGVSIPKKEFVSEHTHLVNILTQKKGLKKEAAKQAKELAATLSASRGSR